MSENGSKSVTIPVKWLTIGLTAVLAIALIVFLTSREDDATESTQTVGTAEELLNELGCVGAEEAYSSSPTVASSYDCEPSETQEYVYFFNTSGDQQAWTSRILSLDDATSLVIGNGWALRTYSSTRLAAALNIDGATQLR